MDTTDQYLIRRTAGGDADAFAELYDRHAARVLGLLLKLTGQRDDAEDLLQEVFSQVWRDAGKYDPARANPEVWLLLLARSRALDYLRRRRPVNGSPPEAALVCETDPTQLLEKSEAAQRVRAALAVLPDEQRKAIQLAFYGGLTHEQIAQSLAVALGTVKTRIRLGMQRLRVMLGELREAPS
jgi:RNA polymerase sigma-70 factor (ECF subfamily)